MQTKWIMLHLGIPFVLSCLSANQDLQEKDNYKKHSTYNEVDNGHLLLVENCPQNDNKSVEFNNLM